MLHLAEAYRRGYALKYAGVENPSEMKMLYFKTKEDLPRVQVVPGFLQGIVPSGQCNSLLDVGSGRGVFLFPLLREFPDLEVTSVDILPHRVELLDCISRGVVENLHTMLENICDNSLPDKSFDVVIMLEVLEHIPTRRLPCAMPCDWLATTLLSLWPPNRMTILSIYLFSNDDLKNHFLNAGCSKVKFMSVTNHRVMIAYL